MLYVILGLVAGIATPTQIGVNTRLRKSMDGRALPPSLLSFLVASVLTQFALLLSGQGFLYPIREMFNYPVWIWLGAYLGLAQLFLKILCFSKIGSVQSMIYLLLGQILSGLAIDHFGLFRNTVTPLTVPRALGALIVIAGVLIASVTVRKSRAEVPTEAQSDAASGLPLPATVFWALVSAFIGLLTSAQIAINACFIGIAGSALKASAIQFHYAVLVLIPLILLRDLKKKDRLFRIRSKGPLWMWLGGPLGALIIYLITFLGSRIGTGVTTILTTVGTIGGSALIDHFGLFGLPQKPVTRSRLLGLAIMVAGVAVLRLF